MRYYQLRRRGQPVLVAHSESTGYDLTSATPELTSFEALVRMGKNSGQPPDSVAAGLVDEADVTETEAPADHGTVPASVDEVWAAGVTYRISEEARTEKSDTPQMYIDVYDADPHNLAISMTIARDGETVYEGETSTAEMVRTCEELVSYLRRHNPLPEVTVLLIVIAVSHYRIDRRT